MVGIVPYINAVERLVREEETLASTFGSIYKKFGQPNVIDRQGNYLFRQVAKNAKAANIDQKTVRDARNWFRNEALNTREINQEKMVSTSGPFEKMSSITQNSIGKMYFYKYDAKWKDKLPYWDQWPLIYPIEYYRDGSFLGINLHYLPPFLRAQLMDALYSTANNQKFDKTTKLQISYQMLKSASRFKAFKPCIKKYLFSHVRSSFIVVNPGFWDYCLLLPMAQFQKAGEDRVWQDSMEKINSNPRPRT